MHYVVYRDIQLHPKIILLILHTVNLLHQPLVTNVKGQVINVLPLIEAQAKKTWSCSTSCKIDPFIIDRYEKFLEAISTCTLKKIPELLHKFHQKCIVNNSTNKLGHTHTCYINTIFCKTMSLPMQHYFHFIFQR